VPELQLKLVIIGCFMIAFYGASDRIRFFTYFGAAVLTIIFYRVT